MYKKELGGKGREEEVLRRQKKNEQYIKKTFSRNMGMGGKEGNRKSHPPLPQKCLERERKRKRG